MQAAHRSSRPSWKMVILFVGGTLLVGALSGLLGGDFSRYAQLNAPPLAPPRWLFFPAWLALYLAMGIAAWLVWHTGDVDRAAALRLYVRQLGVNALWPLFFFRLDWSLFSFFWILLLIALAALTINTFCRHSRAAGWLLIPYLAWLLFAAYLNLGFFVLNH